MVLWSKQFVNHVSINLLGFNLLDLFIEIFKRFYQVTETLQFSLGEFALIMFKHIRFQLREPL